MKYAAERRSVQQIPGGAFALGDLANSSAVKFSKGKKNVRVAIVAIQINACILKLLKAKHESTVNRCLPPQGVQAYILSMKLC